MSDWYYLNVTVHVLAAVFWIGGLLFLGIVGAPVLRKLDLEIRANLFDELGRRFRTAGWIAIIILLVTGVLNLHFRGLLSHRVMTDPLFWSSAYGRAFTWKLGSVALLLTGSFVHDFVLGPAAGRATPGTDLHAKLLRWSAFTARINAVLAIILIYAAVRIARGG